MIQVLLLVHVVLGATLLGALTHQALSFFRRSGPGTHTIVSRFRNVHAPTFTNTIIVLFIASNLLGGLMYPRYRLDVRTVLEDLQLRAANGLFEIKEHFGALGLGILPAYWYYWRGPLTEEVAATRKYLTWMLAFITWWNFLVGEGLNNIRGMFP
jgi:hypothetical protein